MGGQVEKSFEEYAKEGEQIPAPAPTKVPVGAIIGAIAAIAGVGVEELIDRAITPADQVAPSGDEEV